MSAPDSSPVTARSAWKKNWPAYLMEAAELGIFMISAGAFTTLFEFPASPVHRAMPDPNLRRACIGIAMGATACGLIYSPWGQRSGAHMNPSVTLTFLWLKKISTFDALFYTIFQCLGGYAGVLLVRGALGAKFASPAVNYVVTIPGKLGEGGAFAGELIISFIMMTAILQFSNRTSIARYTGCVAGLLIASYVTLEAPLSGFSMNPARTLASALPSGNWTGFWIYLIAPPLGMLLAAVVYVMIQGHAAVLTGKLHRKSDGHLFRA